MRGRRKRAVNGQETANPSLTTFCAVEEIFLASSSVKHINRNSICENDGSRWKFLAIKKIKEMVKKHMNNENYLQIPHSSQWYWFFEVWKRRNKHWILQTRIQLTKDAFDTLFIFSFSFQWIQLKTLKLTSSSKNLHIAQKYFPMQTPQLMQYCWTWLACKTTR